MSFFVYYLIVHLCVSMHACNSRHLRAFQMEPGKEFPVTRKILEKNTGLQGIKDDENIMEGKELMVELLSDEQNMRKGNDIILQISQGEGKIEGWKNRARSTMETKQHDSKEAINNSKDSSITEDVVVMDYAQPHRKPPIHNIEP